MLPGAVLSKFHLISNKRPHYVFWWTDTSEHSPKVHWAQERIPKALAGAENTKQPWNEGFPLRGVTGHFLKMRQASRTSCHLSKLLFWIQLWWQLQSQLATEGNIVLFFWWARSFEASKMIPWLLPSKAGLRHSCQVREASLLNSYPQTHFNFTGPLSSHYYPAPSGISSGCWWLSSSNSPFLSPLLYSNDICSSTNGWKCPMIHLPNYSWALHLWSHNGDTDGKLRAMVTTGITETKNLHQEAFLTPSDSN